MSKSPEIRYTQLARTQDGKIVGTDIVPVGNDDHDAMLNLARRSGENSSLKTLASYSGVGAATLIELGGAVEALIGNRDTSIRDFAISIAVLAGAGAAAKFYDRRIKAYERAVDTLQSGEELPRVSLLKSVEPTQKSPSLLQRITRKSA